MWTDRFLTTKINPADNKAYLTLISSGRPPQFGTFITRAADATNRTVGEIQATTKPILVYAWFVSGTGLSRVLTSSSAIIESAGTPLTVNGLGTPTAVVRSGLRATALPGSSSFNPAMTATAPTIAPFILGPGEYLAACTNIVNTQLDFSLLWIELEA